MSAESIKENAIRKVIQELIVPDIKEIRGKVDILEERIISVKNELKADMGRLDEKINSLDEKIDLMNKFNERLFNIIYPAGQKQP